MILAYLLVAIVAIEHFYIMYLEMFALHSPTAKRVFQLDEQSLANAKIRTLFANQGLYNGFLAAGLVFALLTQQTSMIYFFLICVVVAAIYGAMTANKGILIKQGLPAILALLAMFIS